MPPSLPLVCLDPGHRRMGFADVGLRELPARECLEETVRTVQALEAAGFHRYWLGEHHVRANFHSCPEVLLGVLAAQTRKIRLGTAGVLLPYTRPYKAAEAFRALASWFPGRIDAGVAKGPGAEDAVRPLLLRDSGFAPEAFRADLRQLAELLQASPATPIAPHEAPDLQLWCHASNPDTLEEAARLGMGVGIALFLQKEKGPTQLRAVGRTIEEHYLAHFQPSPSAPRPRVVAVESMICLDNRPILERLRKVPAGPWGTPRLGTPQECLDTAGAIVDAVHATEFGMFQSPYVPELVRRSCLLLAEAAGASGVPLDAAPALSVA